MKDKNGNRITVDQFLKLVNEGAPMPELNDSSFNIEEVKYLKSQIEIASHLQLTDLGELR